MKTEYHLTLASFGRLVPHSVVDEATNPVLPDSLPRPLRRLLDVRCQLGGNDLGE